MAACTAPPSIIELQDPVLVVVEMLTVETADRVAALCNGLDIKQRVISFY